MVTNGLFLGRSTLVGLRNLLLSDMSLRGLHAIIDEYLYFGQVNNLAKK
jgi:hypothetical protein